MKKLIVVILICLMLVAVAQTAQAQDVTELPEAEQGTETVIGIETYAKADYTGWLALEVTVKDGDTKEPLPDVIVSLVNVKTGGQAGTGPAVDEPNPPGFFPQFGKKAVSFSNPDGTAMMLSAYHSQEKKTPPPVNGSNGQFMTDENGQIVFRMYPSPDQYRIEVRQSGYADYVSDPFELHNYGYTEVLLKRPEPVQPAPAKDDAGQPVSAKTVTQGNGPKTGDTIDLMLFIVILAIAAGVIAILAILRVQRKKKEQKDGENGKQGKE